MDELLARIPLALASLALGWTIGTALRARRRRRGAHLEVASSAELPQGIYLLTAPFCARCTTLRQHLTDMQVSFRELDVRDIPDLVNELSIRSAPTLIAVTSGGTVRAIESQSLDIARIDELTADATSHDVPRRCGR